MLRNETMIGRFSITNATLLSDRDNNLQLLVKIAKESNFAARYIADEIKDGEYTLTVDKRKKGRSLDQNALLWALLEKLALHVNGGRTGGVTAWELYIDLLEKYGAKYEYIMCLPDALEGMKKIYRTIKEVERRDYNGKEMAVCKCYYGSSTFDTAEMTLLIEGVIDELAMLGVYDTEIISYQEEMRRDKKHG
jgi:hypothetical protein